MIYVNCIHFIDKENDFHKLNEYNQDMHIIVFIDLLWQMNYL